MVILDQDLLFIEVILNISLKLRPLTTSDEDVFWIGWIRIPEFLWKVPQNDQLSQIRNLRKEKYYLGEKPFPPTEGAIN